MRFLYPILILMSLSTGTLLRAEAPAPNETQNQTQPTDIPNDVLGAGPAAVAPQQATNPDAVVPVESQPQTAESAPQNNGAPTVTENAPPSDSQNAQPAGAPQAEDPELKNQRAAQKAVMKAKLAKKLTKKDGKIAMISVFGPADSTQKNLAHTVVETIQKSFAKLGNFPTREEKFVFDSLNLEEFRKAMTRTGSDLGIATILKPDGFYMYLYDRRTPFYIYAHSEAIPEAYAAQMSPQLAEQYTKLLVRRILYRYSEDQYFEMPRKESPPILKSEIPRWIASPESVERINRDITSRFYVSGAVGAALSSGANGSVWNSNLITLQVAARPYGNWYIEGSIAAFSYNSILLSAKYLFRNHDTPFSVLAGIGLGTLSSKKTFNQDIAHTIQGSNFVVPSVGILIPIMDVYIKAESQIYVGVGQKEFIMTIMPGVLVQF